MVCFAVGKGWSFEGQPFVVSGEWELEDRFDGVVGGDGDLVDEGFEHGLAFLGWPVHEDGSDTVEESAARSSTVVTNTDLVTEALTGPKPPYVAWWVEHKSKNTYLLRNIGTETACNVEIDDSRIPCGSRMPAVYAEIAPDASGEFLLLPAWGHPKPNELWVRWEDHPEWTAVPVP